MSPRRSSDSASLPTVTRPSWASCRPSSRRSERGSLDHLPPGLGHGGRDAPRGRYHPCAGGGPPAPPLSSPIFATSSHLSVGAFVSALPVAPNRPSHPAPP